MNEDKNNLDFGTIPDEKTTEEVGSEVAKQVFAPLQENEKEQVSKVLDEVLSSDENLKKKYNFAMNSLIKKAIFDAIIESSKSTDEEIKKAALKIFEKIKI